MAPLSIHCKKMLNELSHFRGPLQIANHFDAEPFDSSPSNRAKVPVKFVFQKHDAVVENCAVGDEWSASRGEGSGCGICDSSGKLIVETDWWPKERYFDMTIDSGTDCGLVLVINRPYGTQSNVKTIIVGGPSGAGTLGAARALVRDFRDLEPADNTAHVLGVVEVTYRKTLRDKDNREVIGMKWKYLDGGRKRIKRR